MEEVLVKGFTESLEMKEVLLLHEEEEDSTLGKRILMLGNKGRKRS